MTTRRPFSLLHRKRTELARQPGTLTPPKNRECMLTMDIFCDLEPEAMAAFERQTEMRTCRRGQILYSQEDQAEVLFLLKRGRVQLYRLTPTGKRLELAVIEPGTFFGEMPLIGESLRHTFAEAAEDSLICVMSRHDIEGLMRKRSEVALRMIEVLGRRLALCEARLEEMAYRSVPARIAAVLLRLSQGHNGEVVSITHQELGDMIGALRESVTKVLDDFQREGLVELGAPDTTVTYDMGISPTGVIRLAHFGTPPMAVVDGQMAHDLPGWLPRLPLGTPQVLFGLFVLVGIGSWVFLVYRARARSRE